MNMTSSPTQPVTPSIADNEAAPDPNLMQRAASDPNASVWVNASAGTGKTKVLTDRLIRLMLPKPATEIYPERAGTAPHRILCLTYTKAGAGEMLNRIMEILSKWASLSEDGLRATLEHDVLGYTPLPSQIQKARSLFAEVVDTPGGIKIMTIHSFCQSLLGRFPVEANLPPDFSLMGDDETRRLMTQARDSVLKLALSEENDDQSDFLTLRLKALLPRLIITQNSAQISNLLKALSAQRQKIKTAINHYDGLSPLVNAIYDAHHLPTLCDMSDLVTKLAGQISQTKIETLASWFAGSDGTWDQEKSGKLTSWLSKHNLDAPKTLDCGALETLFAALLYRQKQTPKKSYREDNPVLYDQYLSLCAYVIEAQETLRSYDTAWKSEAALILGAAVITEYDRLKTQQNLLDYDDLILKTVHLLQDAPEWVMFKLDGGIDHVLVDEAQDSNAEQWTIIKALIQEFIAGKGQNEDDIRSLFVVGDEKQSIFGFQGADPDVFQEMRQEFGRNFKAADLDWVDQPLNISFRSVQAVLNVVDACFETPEKRQALTGKMDTNILHQAFRKGQAGHVELWPLIVPQDKIQQEPWTVPSVDDATSSPSPQRQLAQNIATEIRGWLDQKRPLSASNAPIRAGDIMILVRRRNSFVDHMIRALKDFNIPVSGVDRMVLGTQITVQDLLALARFTLLPDDDLTLACILKSPFIGLDENTLQSLCIRRKGTLWQTLKNAAKTDPYFAPIIDWLSHLIVRAPKQGVHDFFSDVLQSPCPVNIEKATLTGLQSVLARLGDDCLDALEEFLSRCFDFDLKYRADLQQFLLQFEQSDEDIKREIDEGQDVVRIMTVHGSKGLQSPIVFLPDSVLLSSDKGRVNSFLWTKKKEQLSSAIPASIPPNIPLWNSSAKLASPLYQEHHDALYERQKQEYERLLYVALTRAEDELYICGALNATSSKVQDHSWYSSIKAALKTSEQTTTLLCAYSEHNNAPVKDRLIYKTAQDVTPKQRKKELLSLTEISSKERLTLLSKEFLSTPEQDNGPITKPLTPSRPSDEDEIEQVALSPLKASDHTRRFKRGNIIHALLQFLPDTPQDQRQKLTVSYLALHMDTDQTKQIEQIKDEVFHILDHPDYAPLFSEHSKAEVPLTGIVSLPTGEKTVISGQIDRLYIDPATQLVMIVDYKTNRPAPRDSANIPRVYRKQMQSYRSLLEQLYPDYNIETYILWTDHGMMMDCPPL